MSCGIKRETIGDILISDTFSVVACTGVSAEIICDEVSKIGRLGVRIEKDYSGELPQSKFIMLDEIVPSLRLDCIIGAVTKLSREKSALLLKSGSVVHNGTEEKNVSKNISLGDIFTIKGYGKFSLSEIGGKTKSDRIHIKIKKFL